MLQNGGCGFRWRSSDEAAFTAYAPLSPQGWAAGAGGGRLGAERTGMGHDQSNGETRGSGERVGMDHGGLPLGQRHAMIWGKPGGFLTILFSVGIG
jgi:hypothetical protein